MRDLKGKTAVITGAASGIGLALAHALARAGMTLLLADRDAERLAAAQNELTRLGATCQAQVLDVAQPGALEELAQAAARLGGADLLVNNAGVALMARVEVLTEADAHWLMDINFWGVVRGCRAFLPQLKVRPEAMIINVSSIFAMVSMPTQSMYNAAKAAVRAFSDALREELRATPVKVLCVHPGGIRTRIAENSRMEPTSTMGDSPEVLRARFLAQARTSPEEAAQAILAAIRADRTRLLIGGDAKFLDLMFRLAPARSTAWFTALMLRMRRRAAAAAR
ncbi:MAG: SDR family NAD(P)-dependent oxidoreductase [Burkholderiales bacterium]|nr:SDR family NAD(P)-dependent oxidoreductase [Burkholderiales bacterium]